MHMKLTAVVVFNAEIEGWDWDGGQASDVPINAFAQVSTGHFQLCHEPTMKFSVGALMLKVKSLLKWFLCSDNLRRVQLYVDTEGLACWGHNGRDEALLQMHHLCKFPQEIGTIAV